MREFGALLRRQLLIVSVLAAVLILTFFASLIIDTNSRTSSADLRSRLSIINSAIRAAHDYARLDDRDAQLALQQAAEKVERSSPEAMLSEDLSKALEALKENPDEEALSAAVDLLGDTARGISADFYRIQRRNSILTIISGLALSLLLALFVILSFRVHRHHLRYTQRTGTLLRSIEKVLNYEHDEIGFTPLWQEELELKQRADAIAAGQRSNRDLIDHPVYGTLEAFIPKMKQILERSIPCDRLAVAFLDNGGNVIAESASSNLPDIQIEPGYSEALSATSLPLIIESRKSRIINDLELHYRKQHRSRSTELILKEGIKSNLTIPIEVQGNILGFLFISSTKVGAFNSEHVRIAEKTLNLLKQNLLYHYVIQEIVAETTNAFVTLMERKDNETSLHITRMSRYSYVIARNLASEEESLTPMKLREIRWFAPLHDIGKIGVPDAILQKNGSLDRVERKTIEEHVEIGLEVIRSMNMGINRILALHLLNTAEEIICSHHERFDGTGYPLGLAGEEIPLAGRIVALADVFDALTSKRPYKEAFSVEKAIGIIEEGVGTHFDPRVYRAFRNSLNEIIQIYERYKEV